MDEFLSPPSARRATFGALELLPDLLISIPALREEGDAVDSLLSHHDPISIPALREEGD